MTYTIHKIKDFCQVGDGAHASLQRENTGIMYLTSKNFKSNGLDLTNLDYISQSSYEKHFKISKSAITTPSVNDVLLGIIGSIGVPYLVKDGEIFGISSSVAILRAQKGLDAKFLFYFMKSSVFQQSVDAIKSGAAQGFLSLEMIKNLPLIAPKENIQKQIAAILSAYDDLIETNNQRIATLEQLAQQIYKEWFVRMRFPGWEHTPLHHGIPEDWAVCRLESLCRNLTDGTHDSPKPVSNGHFLITGKHINRDNFIDFSQAYFISEADHKKISDRSNLDEGDIIFSNIGTIGSCAIIMGENDFSVKNVLIFKPKEKYLTTYLFYLLTNKSTLEQLLLSASGASQQFIGLTFARNFKVLVPKDNLLKQFNVFVEPLVEQKFALKESNLMLTKTRNLLLPRLISGKLTLKQANASL